MRPAVHVPTVIIGGGHAGFAMSRRLTERSIRHVVLERGAVANSWRTERWDSLRLLTPNWQTRLPGMGYRGDDPDGYMTMPEVADFIAAYPTTIAAPVHTGTTVTRVSSCDLGSAVETDRGGWTCDAVVIASGGSPPPAPQLIGTPEHRSIDLNALMDRGVEIVGRLGRISDGVAQFSGSLANVCKMADLKMNRLLQSFDDWADSTDATGVGPAERFEATRVPSPPRPELDFDEAEIDTIVWATGYRPDYSWLDVPVRDQKGRIRHDGGVSEAPGLYVTGLNVLRRRRSSFINGAEADSEELSEHLQQHLDKQATH